MYFFCSSLMSFSILLCCERIFFSHAVRDDSSRNTKSQNKCYTHFFSFVRFIFIFHISPADFKSATSLYSSLFTRFAHIFFHQNNSIDCWYRPIHLQTRKSVPKSEEKCDLNCTIFSVFVGEICEIFNVRTFRSVNFTYLFWVWRELNIVIDFMET